MPDVVEQSAPLGCNIMNLMRLFDSDTARVKDGLQKVLRGCMALGDDLGRSMPRCLGVNRIVMFLPTSLKAAECSIPERYD